MSSTVVPEWSHFDVGFIDLDDTLYHNPHVPEQITRNMGTYVRRILSENGRRDITEDDATKYGYNLYRTHGSTLVGLQTQGYHVDLEDWCTHVYKTLPYRTLFPRDDALRSALERVPIPLYVFTNAHEKYARTVLDHLSLTSCFRDVIGFETIQSYAKRVYLFEKGEEGILRCVCKPDRIAFEAALQCAGNPDPTRCLFVDDRASNVESASEMGMTAYWLVGPSSCGLDRHPQMQMQLPDARIIQSICTWLQHD